MTASSLSSIPGSTRLFELLFTAAIVNMAERNKDPVIRIQEALKFPS